ncbi:MAG: hypothetical protein H6815_06875 [Phycisphaeraceae bacterium]|nr:hypothetical protein [Phycisphaerales bacterium]MCB9860162.1 hypothetical protein [Phycisphaeraceae bacterium]
MPTRLTISVPSDYVLARDVCSYGYFLLAPNFWVPETGTFWRVLTLDSGPVRVGITQHAAKDWDLSSTQRHTKKLPKKLKDATGKSLRVTANRELSKDDTAQTKAQIKRMLRLDEPAVTLQQYHKLDTRFRQCGRGRLMRSPTLFEDIIKTVTSCNVQWPSTITMNARLCDVVGKRIEPSARARDAAHVNMPVPEHAFPTPEQLARTRVTTLRARCRTGYRDARIIELAKLFAMRGKRPPTLDAAWFEDPKISDDDLRAALIDLPGIGPYAANNIMQLLGRYHLLPLDTETVRHGKGYLELQGTDAQIMKKVKAYYERLGEHAFRSYWFELMDDYQTRKGPSWTWSHRVAGSFTASKLD